MISQGKHTESTPGSHRKLTVGFPAEEYGSAFRVTAVPTRRQEAVSIFRLHPAKETRSGVVCKRVEED